MKFNVTMDRKEAIALCLEARGEKGVLLYKIVEVKL